MGFIDYATTSLVTSVAKAVTSGNKKLKILFFFALFFTIAAIVIAVLVDSDMLSKIYNSVAIGLGIIAGICILVIYAYQMSVEETQAKLEIQKVEERIKGNGNETAAAWELGRIKLESYLNRNLSQIQWIFIWTVIVMIASFVIVSYGIVQVYEGDQNLNAAILTTISGLIIEFIGASFLVIYKSTMQQAKDYVTVLERINAVGMSVQILDSISEEENKLKDQTKADLAKKLLDIYGNLKSAQ
ncbi:TRADD-N-associated membrane domain-containing protein [Cyclobacterium qasimii]|uniref:Cyanobacterial TRADD-N associated 2 transmembrane domain-containing protein n=2 Tax=Cyclobacterium qasimii TaxID=1350429 RepID=S7V7Z1_9BACT|nr:hypothetical protein [Cyclobacterium qasimii]EPR65682.1 hypothetical protein ADICYQ_5317 [Cyclobacterium qasimii M12-11B]GEO23560.1 hypothetical protein CQA01_40940 [Cyclobacterium qasimii]